MNTENSIKTKDEIIEELSQFARDIIRYLEAGTIQTKSDRRFVIFRAKEVLEIAKTDN